MLETHQDSHPISMLDIQLQQTMNKANTLQVIPLHLFLHRMILFLTQKLQDITMLHLLIMFLQQSQLLQFMEQVLKAQGQTIF